MNSAGALVTPAYGEDDVAYLSVCDAHREDGRVFREKSRAQRHAQEHNDAHHHGRAPRFRSFGSDFESTRGSI